MNAQSEIAHIYCSSTPIHTFFTVTKTAVVVVVVVAHRESVLMRMLPTESRSARTMNGGCPSVMSSGTSRAALTVWLVSSPPRPQRVFNVTGRCTPWRRNLKSTLGRSSVTTCKGAIQDDRYFRLSMNRRPYVNGGFLSP